MSDAALVIVAVIILYLLSSIKILREYERGVIFRLGRLLHDPKGPGVILVSRAYADRMVRASHCASTRWKFLRKTSSRRITSRSK